MTKRQFEVVATRLDQDVTVVLLFQPALQAPHRSRIMREVTKVFGRALDDGRWDSGGITYTVLSRYYRAEAGLVDLVRRISALLVTQGFQEQSRG